MTSTSPSVRPRPMRARPVASRSATKVVAALHVAVSKLVADLPCAAAARETPAGLRVRSMRNKPGRGVTATYAWECIDRRGPSLITAAVDDDALSSPGLAKLLIDVGPRDWRGDWPGTVHGPVPGLAVTCFPTDENLPSLRAATDLRAGSRIADALANAVARLTEESDRCVISGHAEVVRYRPGARCVVRYLLTTRRGLDEPMTHVVYGKFYRQVSAAVAAHDLATRLSQAPAPHRDLVPRPLALVADMGLVLSKAAGDSSRAAVSGRTLLHPCTGTAGLDAARSAGHALAWLHTVAVAPGPGIPRTAATELHRARSRLKLLATIGMQAPVNDLAAELLGGFAGARCERLRLVHGAFRPNQLIFADPATPSITDLDGAGAGDPALDIGEFLAHLRRPKFFASRPEHRAWWQRASALFTQAYCDAMIRAGAGQAEVSTSMDRAALFEASAIVRMAGHRVRRLSSPRPREFAAMVAEASRCMARHQVPSAGLP
jgi:hypothetical protein